MSGIPGEIENIEEDQIIGEILSQNLGNAPLSASSRANWDQFWVAFFGGGCTSAWGLINQAFVGAGEYLRYIWGLDQLLCVAHVLLCLIAIVSSPLWKKYRLAAEVTVFIVSYICLAVPSVIISFVGAFRHIETRVKITVTVSLLETFLISAVRQFITLDETVSKVSAYAANVIVVLSIGTTAIYLCRPNDAAPVQQGQV